MASPPPKSARTTLLRTRAHAFCTDFTSNTPPTEMLDRFFTPDPAITEHGPAWAQSRLPFLGKTFVGRRHRRRQNTQTQTPSVSSTSTSTPNPNPNPPTQTPQTPQHDNEEEHEEDHTTCDAYFALLARTLTFHPTTETFPPADGLVVDADAEGGTGVVSVVGRAEFRSVRTGRGWVEEFVWRLGGWDAEGRVGAWEIWADPLSAWVAVGEGAGEGEGEGS